MHNILALVFLFITFTNLTAQDVRINEIIIKGNDRTKERVILRELNFSEGDTIELIGLEEKFTQTRLQILSTGLFNNVTLKVADHITTESTVNIEIIVEENWYFFPVPIFELADRNFNVWLKEQEASLSRTNYGFKLSHFNTTGNRDPIRVKVHFGYTRKYELTYSYPYLAYDNKLGIGGSIFYSENREIAFQTIGNKTQFRMLEDERKLLSRFRIGPEIKFRPDLYSFHSLRLEYHHNQVDDFVATVLNPDYFLDGRTELRFFFIEYDFNYDRRLYSQYPQGCLLYTSPSPRDGLLSRMPSSA